MGTIVKRFLSDGRVRYSAQLLIKRDGSIVYRESKTFDQFQTASDWLTQREKEVKSRSFNYSRDEDITLGTAIGKYLEITEQDIGRSQLQVLRTLQANAISNEKCKDISSPRLLSLFRSLGERCQPQTVATYASGLASVFSVAKPALNIPLDIRELREATTAARRLKIICKDSPRSRRPTLNELDILTKRCDGTQIQRICQGSCYSQYFRLAARMR